MATWSTQRKVSYLSIVFGVIFVFVVLPLFIFLYQKPTCFDGRKNGDEVGVDCGGSCQILCSFETIDPIVLWSRAFKVTDGVYSAAAYIENSNINSEAIAEYTFKLYDENNALIGTRSNRTFIPKNNVIAIFEPNIETGIRIPKRVTFEWDKKLVWRKNLSPSTELSVTKKTLSNEDTKPRIDATIENKSVVPQSNIEAVAIVYDAKENAIGVSRTFITDKIDKDNPANIVFTWPSPFETKEEICRVGGVVGDRQQALGVVLAIDRSGSMARDGQNPPQPLTDAKNAAVSFVNQLKETDEVGVVSFATEATEPPDSALTTEYDLAKSALLKISILPEGTQYTNLGDGIEKAAKAFLSPAFAHLTEQVIVLLTDGQPTKPEKTGEKNYPAVFAEEKATEAKNIGAEIFIIGLGKEVDAEFLKKIATTPEHYFGAATGKELEDIYKQIAIRLCKNPPAIIEVIPRVIPASF